MNNLSLIFFLAFLFAIKFSKIFYNYINITDNDLKNSNNFLNILLLNYPVTPDDCGTINDPLKINSMTMNNTNPKKGDTVLFTMNGTVIIHEDLKDVTVLTLQNGAILSTDTVSKTDGLDPGSLFLFNYTLNLPTILPSGQYRLNFTVHNVNQINIACKSIKFPLN